ncbi:hypothetical protein [Silanimonas sp.]|uniref:hypothetical protein n=1 Tax=Silanimonas sp. TaxID=1929290 RepID=UPI0037C80BCE
MRTMIATACAAVLMLSSPIGASAPASTLPTEQQYAIPDGPRQVQRFEISTRGTLVVEPDGRVTEVELDMPASTREIYRAAMSTWRFKPVDVDGRVVRAKAHFLLDATGERLPGSDQVKLGIENIVFIDPPSHESANGERAPRNDLRPPTYPMTPAREGYGAKVMLMVRVDAEGHVVGVGVHSLALAVDDIQHRLRAIAFARQFASASMRAARGWRFRDPGVIASGTALVPVQYTPPGRAHSGWQPRIPVEVTPLPWMTMSLEGAVAMTPLGEAASSSFQLLDDVAGTSVN